jgi:molecular chaperone DnaK (HSP70)
MDCRTCEIDKNKIENEIICGQCLNNSRHIPDKTCIDCKNRYGTKCNSIDNEGCKKYKRANKQQGTSQTAIHYQQAEVQPIEIMQMYMTKEQFIGFLKGNIIKYTLRAGHKDSEITDITKAQQYLLWFKLALQGIKIEPMKHVLKDNE